MEEFRSGLVDYINSSPLPLDAKYYLLKDVLRDVKDVYYAELQKLKEKEVSKDE